MSWPGIQTTKQTAASILHSAVWAKYAKTGYRRPYIFRPGIRQTTTAYLHTAQFLGQESKLLLRLLYCTVSVTPFGNQSAVMVL